MVWTAGQYLRRMHVRTVHSISGVCICCFASNGTNLFGTMMYGVNEATQTHCYNPIALAYPVWAYCAHGRQRRCQEDPVSLPSSRLENTTRSSPHHVAQHRPTGSETKSPYAPRSSRYCSEPPSVGDDVDIWRYAILELHASNDDDNMAQSTSRNQHLDPQYQQIQREEIGWQDATLSHTAQ